MALQTRLYLESHLPRPLAAVAHDYILPLWRAVESWLPDIKSLSYCDLDEKFLEACRSGHGELVDILINAGVTNWTRGLYGACHGGHIELVKQLIERGAVCRGWSLNVAATQGHLELADLLMRDYQIMPSEFTIQSAEQWNHTHVADRLRQQKLAKKLT